jgi:hypothetical protein
MVCLVKHLHANPIIDSLRDITKPKSSYEKAEVAMATSYQGHKEQCMQFTHPNIYIYILGMPLFSYMHYRIMQKPHIIPADALPTNPLPTPVRALEMRNVFRSLQYPNQIVEAPVNTPPKIKVGSLDRCIIVCLYLNQPLAYSYYLPSKEPHGYKGEK